MNHSFADLGMAVKFQDFQDDFRNTFTRLFPHVSAELESGHGFLLIPFYCKYMILSSYFRNGS